jgi:preprotein translocase subunit SecE
MDLPSGRQLIIIVVVIIIIVIVVVIIIIVIIADRTLTRYGAIEQYQATR